MTQIKVDPLLQEIKSGLEHLYGTRLRAVYLYGSYARREQDAESDLDILVILSDYLRYSVEIERTGHLVSELSLKYGVSISRKFITEEQWTGLTSAYLRNLRAEAIAA